MKVQLIHPPHPAAIEDRLDAPLGLLRIATILTSEGHDVTVTDLTNGTDWDIKEADVFGISCYAPTAELSGWIARACKGKYPEAITVAGGAHITGLIESDLNNMIPSGFDCSVAGSGELAMLDILRDYPYVSKVYERPLESDLDIYPQTNYEFVDIMSYQRKINGHRSVSIATSLGCPYRCAFCGLPKQHRRVRFRSPENVIEEIKGLILNHGIRAFNFQDDTFFLNKTRSYRLLELLAPLDVSFRCHGRAGLDTKEDYQMLKKAGCAVVGFGIESGSQTILDHMNKGVTVEQNAEVIRWAQECGLTDRIFLVVNFPGETPETLAETREFIEAVNPSQLFISTFQPYPGTDVWKRPAHYGITRLLTDFSDYLQIYGKGRGCMINYEMAAVTNGNLKAQELEFRQWASGRKSRGEVQDYEHYIKGGSQ